jgi:hypothetical protein
MRKVELTKEYWHTFDPGKDVVFAVHKNGLDILKRDVEVSRLLGKFHDTQIDEFDYTSRDKDPTDISLKH